MSADASVRADADAQRLRAHAAIAPLAAVSSLLVAVLLVWACAAAIPPQRLALWLLALAPAVALRAWLPLRQHGVAEASADAGLAGPALSLRLRRCRFAVLLHGLVWGAVAWLPPSLDDPALQATLIILLLGLAVGAMTLTLFDLAAALLVALPVLLPLALRLLATEAPLPRPTLVAGTIAGLLLIVLTLAGRRVELQRLALAAMRRAERLALQQSEASRRAAAEQQRMLALVLERTEQGFWYIDNALRTTDANPAMCRMLGVDHDQLVGRSIHDFVDPANRAIFEAQAQRRAEGQAGAYEITLRRADGSAVHCFNNATPVFDSQGRKTGALGLFSDISAQKRSEQEIRRAGELLAQKSQVLERTLESLSQGVLNVDPSGRCIAWNQRLLELLKLPPELMLGQPRLADLLAWQMAHDEFGSQLERLDETGRQSLGKAIDGMPLAEGHRYRRTRADGTVLEVVSRFAADGSLVRTFTDITASVAAEAALVAARDEAERERELAERASRAKSEFLSRMSHELRTPLNAILGFGQLLQADAGDPLSPGQRERLDELLRGARHLLTLINDVLDVARIEAGSLQLTLAPVDLVDLARECLQLVQPMAQARAVALALRFEPALPAWQVMADPTRLKQVLLNLLTNAIKYNRDAGEVRIGGRRTADGLVVEVADQGPGIRAEHQARLFQPFERLDRDGTVEGTGIGLALSRSLVELMHGEIGVRSAPGAGSVFWVRLPDAAAAVAAPLPDAPAMPSGTPGRRCEVLYIEDNAVNQLLMQGMLAHRPNIALRLAAHPEEGLAMAAAQLPDLVLLDIQLPGFDGFEVLRRLRELPALRYTPVIAVSANAMPDDLAAARRAGFADYLTKPLEMNRLLALVDRALG
ncbi:MAG: PAS-domain containing protein [Burkholderiaceae bacterium]|nr:PAS-domain containing protein [Burkholderiaceae bacterium]